jgi:intermediate peptidase
LGNPETEIEFPDPHRLLAGLGTQMVNNMEWGSTARGQDPTSVYVKPGTMQAACINQWAQNAKAREILYKGVNAPDPRKVTVLEEMLRARGELATVLGKETYAHVALADKMAKTTRNVDKFLTSLVKHQRPAAEADLLKLRLHKAQMVVGKYYRDTNEHTGPLPEIHAWDRDYFTLFRQSKMEATNSLSPYLSVGTVINGLSQLFDRLYGISFRPASVAPGEVWDPSIRRVNVVHETEGQIGVIYFDLWTRAGKSSAAAHFTVRCSRRVDDDDVAGDGLEPGWDATFGPGLETEGSAIKGKEGRYQLPIVVLTTDFGVERQKTPKLLTWHDVDVLFHEMGHAIHCKSQRASIRNMLTLIAMIGRTEFHNVSGTRCATDFVELPSILMEHFAASPDVLCSFAKHHETNKPIPRELVNAHVAQHQDMGALDTHNQILMALLDQKYHNLTVDQLRDPSFNSTKMLYDLNSQYSVIKPVENTGWQTSFGHLHGYGATYYSYLLDRAIAGKVWSTLFTSEEEGSLSRKGGEVFKEKVLKWGGGKDPWEMVGDVVGGQEGEVVARGDEKSMDVVGSWLTKG